MLRRAVLDDVGLFDESFRHAEDYDLWLRIGKEHRLGYVSEPLVRCRRHRHNMSKDIGAHQEFERRALQKVTPSDARAAFLRLFSERVSAEEAWIWFLLRSGNPMVTEELYRTSVEHPESKPLQFALGVYLYDAARHAEAHSVFSRLQDSDATAVNNAVVAAVACGRTATAYDDLQLAIQLRPDYHDARYNVEALLEGKPLRLTRRPFRESLVPIR